jgi:hypothetical protein
VVTLGRRNADAAQNVDHSITWSDGAGGGTCALDGTPALNLTACFTLHILISLAAFTSETRTPVWTAADLERVIEIGRTISDPIKISRLAVESLGLK